jgi:hypothetical protein
LVNYYTFDGVTIPYPLETGRSYTPNLHITIQSKKATLQEIADMFAKVGTFSETVVNGGLVSTKGTATLGTLVYATETWSNCRIIRDSFKVDRYVLNDPMSYTMTLAQDTAI